MLLTHYFQTTTAGTKFGIGCCVSRNGSKMAATEPHHVVMPLTRGPKRSVSSTSTRDCHARDVSTSACKVVGVFKSASQVRAIQSAIRSCLSENETHVMRQPQPLCAKGGDTSQSVRHTVTRVLYLSLAYHTNTSLRCIHVRATVSSCKWNNETNCKLHTQTILRMQTKRKCRHVDKQDYQPNCIRTSEIKWGDGGACKTSASTSIHTNKGYYTQRMIAKTSKAAPTNWNTILPHCRGALATQSPTTPHACAMNYL